MLKKLASETAIYGLSSIVGRLLNYLLVPLYTRLFTQSEYGIVSELYALTGFLMVLFIYRIETAFFRFGTDPARRQQAFDTSLRSVVATSVLFSATILLFSKNITAWLQYLPEQHWFVVIFGLILAFDTLVEIPLARLRLEHRPKRFAAVRMAGIAANISLNLFFLLLCPWLLENGLLTAFVGKVYHPAFGVGYIFLSNLLSSALVLLLLSPEMFTRGSAARPVAGDFENAVLDDSVSVAQPAILIGFDGQLWRRMMAYAAPLILASLAGIVNEMLDRELLKHLLPGTPDENLAQIGIYSACYKLAMLMSLFTQAFRYAAEPFFFANAKKKEARQLYADVAKYFTIAGAFAFLAVLLYLDVFRHFIDERYWAGLGVVPILLMANLFLGIYYNVSTWYKLTDQTKLGGWVAVGGAAITIVLNLWWIPRIGYMGSAWATLVCYAAMSVACWWLGQKYYPVPYDLRRMSGYVLLALGLYLGSEVLAEKTGLGGIVLWIVNTLFLLLFAGVVWKAEGKSIVKSLRTGT